MSINHAILGILSCRPSTGYDLKKVIQDSAFMHWSGNNNQIYKALVELLDDGFVTSEVQHQEGAPSKKVYAITNEGLDALREWVMSAPEPPEFKNLFLVQLAWADQLDAEALDRLLAQYEHEIMMRVAWHQEASRRGQFAPNRTAKETFLWEMIDDNVLSYYKKELDWLRKLRSGLGNFTKGDNIVQYEIVEKNSKKYILYASAETPIRTEQDAMDLVAASMEQDTNLLMIYAEALHDDFYNLKTGLAGSVLQKFMNYQRKAAVVMTEGGKMKGRFKEFAVEANKGSSFRVFASEAEAESWLIDM